MEKRLGDIHCGFVEDKVEDLNWLAMDLMETRKSVHSSKITTPMVCPAHPHIPLICSISTRASKQLHSLCSPPEVTEQ